MHRFRHTAMATEFEIRCTHPDRELAWQAARSGFEAVDRLEQHLSRFVENSDISRINHLQAGESTIVSYETMECLKLAAAMFAETQGAFDASIGTGFENLELLAEAFVVRAGSDSVRLDLGGIGKGFAVDRLADVLEDWEVDHALIDAGRSSVLALEAPAGEEAWPLTLSDPGDPGTVLARIGARQRALGASGIRKGDHIWDSRERAPVRSRQAVWVSAPRRVLEEIGRQAGVERSAAAVADALSTAFMSSPAEKIETYCRRQPGLEVWVLDQTLVHFPDAEGPNPSKI